MQRVVLQQFAGLLFMNLFKEVFVLELDHILLLQRLLMIWLLSRSIKEGHVEEWGTILVVSFVDYEVDSAQIIRILVFLGEFIVESEVVGLVCVKGSIFHNGRILFIYKLLQFINSK